MSFEKKKSVETRRLGRLFPAPQSIDTSAATESDDIPTPIPTSSTAASTHSIHPINVPTPRGVRGKSDLRSPGANKTPTVQSSSTSIPDFITQTDKFGNATTPRSADALTAAKKSSITTHDTAPFDEDQPVETVEGEDNGESILENLRLMCCCLLSDVAYPDQVNKDVITSPPPMASDGEKPVGETNNTTTGTTNSTHNNRRKRNNETKMKTHLSIVSCGRSLVDDETEPMKLLPTIHPHDEGKKCLVLDLDETLVHSSFRAVSGADFVLPVQIEDVVHFVYVSKRPGVDFFLAEMAKYYEVVVYTASLCKYADPLLDQLDPNGCIRARLFRDSCVYHEGNYVKDLSRLDRDITQAIIIDNSPSSYIFHPENAIDCTSYIDDVNDRELDHIAKFLKGIRKVHDVRQVCSMWRQWPQIPHTDGILYPHNDLESSSGDEKKSDKLF